jgi:mono/diheme cytochrome c family protein
VVKKILLAIFVLLVVGIGGGLMYLTLRKPAMAEPSTIRVERTADRVARGKYLFDHVNGCADCHSVVDQSRFGFPVASGGYAKGKAFPEAMGLPGTIVAPNLTSDQESGLGNWTDGEILRAVREGIGKDGRALFPFMPYPEYAHLSDEDAHSLVAYMRTIPPIRNPVPRTEVAFPVNLFIKGVPKPVASVPAVNASDKVAYGRYLAKVAGCEFCHTPVKNNAPVAGMEFAGGHELALSKDVVVRSFNLTPHNETGIGRWTEDQFLEKFSQYKEYAEKGSPQIDLRDNTIMPWLNYSGMTRDDLAAIFAYLKTLPAISNAVETKPSASEDGKKGKS